MATLTGYSGFVRGGFLVALAGTSLAVFAGVLSMWMLFYSYRLDKAGVGPLAQFGLRFPLYTVLALGGFAIGLDHKADLPSSDIALAVGIGLFIMAFPMYAMQKAVPLVPSITIGTITALGPFFIFALQLLEGRVDYAPMTMVGLIIFFAGAVLAAYGSSQADRSRAIGTRP